METVDKKENLIFPIIILFLVTLLPTLILVPLNILTFESRSPHPYAHSTCMAHCLGHSKDNFLSYHHLESIALFAGFPCLLFTFLIYPYAHFFYVDPKHFGSFMMKKAKLFWPRFFAMLVTLLPIILGLVLKIFVKGWPYFAVACSLSIIHILLYRFLYPKLLKMFKVDVPCDLFMTALYVEEKYYDLINTKIIFDFPGNYHVYTLLKTRNNAHMIRGFKFSYERLVRILLTGNIYVELDIMTQSQNASNSLLKVFYLKHLVIIRFSSSDFLIL